MPLLIATLKNGANILDDKIHIQIEDHGTSLIKFMGLDESGTEIKIDSLFRIDEGKVILHQDGKDYDLKLPLSSLAYLSQKAANASRGSVLGSQLAIESGQVIYRMQLQEKLKLF